MSLETLLKALPQEEVSYMGDLFYVRGLSLTHVSALVASRRADLQVALGRWADVQGDAGAFATVLISELPALAGAVIAHGADRPDLAEQIAAGLPAPVQVEALAKIARLTFENPVKAGEFLATVLRAVQVSKAVATSAASLKGSEPTPPC